MDKIEQLNQNDTIEDDGGSPDSKLDTITAAKNDAQPSSDEAIQSQKPQQESNQDGEVPQPNEYDKDSPKEEEDEGLSDDNQDENPEDVVDSSKVR